MSEQKQCTQIDFAEAAGKTILAVVKCDEEGMLISFDDHTFSYVSIYGGGDWADLETEADFSIMDHDLARHIKPAFGDAGQAMYYEAVAAKQERRRLYDIKATENRRKEYMKLHQEFGKEISNE